MHRRTTILVLTGLLLGASSTALAAPPSRTDPSSGGSTSSNTSIGNPYGSPPSGATYSPDTAADPGLVSGGVNRPTDKTYGAPGGGPEGAGGYDILDPNLVDEQGWNNGVPDYHIVRKGDTLWDICTYYFGDPYLWPKIWSYNEQITNAHWIFPGDRVRLTDPYDRVIEETPSLNFGRTKALDDLENQVYVLNRYAYVDADDYDRSMEVVGGHQAKVMMSLYDTAYVGYESKNPPIAGERLAVYKKKIEVRDIEYRGKKKKEKKGEVIGYLVEVVGEVYIENVAKKSAETTVVDSVQPIERGMKVGELQTRFSRIEPVPAQSTESGLVIHAIRDYNLVGEEQWVVVNIGANESVRRGNILDVVRKGDEYTEDHKWHPRYEDGHPRRVMGKVLVVQVGPDSALCVVIYSEKEVMRGDHVEMRAPMMDETEQPDMSERARPSGSGNADLDAKDGKVEGEAGFTFGR